MRKNILRKEGVSHRELEDFIPAYQKAREEELKKMFKYLNKHDYKSMISITHNWKGHCRPYGYAALEELSKRLEFELSKNNEDQVNTILQQVECYLAAKGKEVLAND